MSISSLGMLGSMATNTLAQTKGSEVERASNDTARIARETDSEERTEAAEGIEQTEEEASAGDRDADGRRMWEEPLGGKRPADEEVAEAENCAADDTPKSKDATGEAGRNLDLSG